MGCNILVVDDSKLARMAISKALNVDHPDWVRLEARNADEALEHVKSLNVDIALIDFNMPGRDGLTLAAELRQLKPGLPVAIVSANHQDEIIQRARATGAVFLQKPLIEQALRQFLDDAVRQLTAETR
jgi:CheY-like chemotaxis protein